MKLIKLALVTSLFLGKAVAFAHGENKPGPHGGEIRMPGAFHTEVVLVTANKLKIYLLDINWKNSTVTNSSVDANFSGHHKSQAVCEKDKDAFLCSFDESVNLKHQGTLVIKAIHNNQKGNAVEYKTPLKF